MYTKWRKSMPSNESRDVTASAPEARSSRDARLNLRASARQDALIRQAASTVDKSVTEFVLESATLAAEQVLADRRWFVLDDASWEAFQTALERPVVFKPRLSTMLNEPNFFQD
jgi:uncharacterized protein (DUF1778 family)